MNKIKKIYVLKLNVVITCFIIQRICISYFPCISALIVNQSTSVRRDLGVVRVLRAINDRRSQHTDEDSEVDICSTAPLTAIKSAEKSSFWYAVSESQSQPTENDVIPYQSKLDMDGSLPYGSYRTLSSNDDYDTKKTCIITTAINISQNDPFRALSQDQINVNKAIDNIQKLIDSGFTSFQLANGQNIPSQKKNLNSDYDHKNQSSLINYRIEQSYKLQSWTENFIYRRLVEETPSSIISLCNLSTKIYIPSSPPPSKMSRSSSDDDDFLPLGKYTKSNIREKIGQSIQNIYGRSNNLGCLDSLQVQYQHNGYDAIGNDIPSPYILEVLDVAKDMQREGYIRSISASDFTSRGLDYVHDNGFDVDFNQVCCNIIDPSKYDSWNKRYSQSKSERKKLMMSSPLAGGLLTNKYTDIPRQFQNKDGGPFPSYMTLSEQRHFESSLKKVWSSVHSSNNLDSLQSDKQKRIRQKSSTIWERYQNKVLSTLQKIAAKHEVSVSTVSLRWCMQLENCGSVVVGTHLNALDDTDDRIYKRPVEWRQAFTLQLDDDDMNALWEVSGRVPSLSQDEEDLMMDMALQNKKLWL